MNVASATKRLNGVHCRTVYGVIWIEVAILFEALIPNLVKIFA